MNPGRKRWLLRLALVLVVGLAGLLYALSARSRNITFENRSGQTIALLQATVGGAPNTFRDVPAGGEVSAPCQTKDGDRFALDGRLQDGTRIRANGTVGDSLHFIVLPGGEVKLRLRGTKSP